MFTIFSAVAATNNLFIYDGKRWFLPQVQPLKVDIVWLWCTTIFIYQLFPQFWITLPYLSIIFLLVPQLYSPLKWLTCFQSSNFINFQKRTTKHVFIQLQFWKRSKNLRSDWSKIFNLTAVPHLPETPTSITLLYTFFEQKLEKMSHSSIIP